MSVEPEAICGCCGCGTESGWRYPSCADSQFRTADERWEAHATWCRPSSQLCRFCEDELGIEAKT